MYFANHRVIQTFWHYRLISQIVLDIKNVRFILNTEGLSFKCVFKHQLCLTWRFCLYLRPGFFSRSYCIFNCVLFLPINVQYSMLCYAHFFQNIMPLFFTRHIVSLNCVPACQYPYIYSIIWHEKIIV